MARTQRFPFPAEHLAAASADYEAGLTCAQVAQKYGTPLSTTRKALFDAGVAMRTNRKTHSAEQLPKMAEDYRNGMTYREIAAKWGGSDVSAQRALIDFGVVSRTTEESKDLRTGRGIHDEDEMIQLYLAGWKMNALARHYQVKNQKVGEVLRRRGVQLRSGGIICPAFATPAQCEALAAEYRDVGNVRALAEKHGRTTSDVLGALRRAGQPVTRWGHPPVWTDATVDRAVAMFKLGVPTDLIAKTIGTTYGAVRMRLYERGELARPSSTGPGERTDPGDYVTVRMEPGDEQFVMATYNGQVAEHRLVMGRKLGRPVASGETVHHINGHRDDNHPDNLQLRRGHHGSGQAWACGDCGSANVVSVPLEGRDS